MLDDKGLYEVRIAKSLSKKAIIQIMAIRADHQSVHIKRNIEETQQEIIV